MAVPATRTGHGPLRHLAHRDSLRWRDLACEAQPGVESAVARFAEGDDGRSVAVRSLRGAEVDVGVQADVVRPAASLVKLGAGVRGAAHPASTCPRACSGDQLGDTVYASVLAVLEPGARAHGRRAVRPVPGGERQPGGSDYLLGLVGTEAVNGAPRRLGATDTRIEMGFSDAELGSSANVTTARDALAMVGLQAEAGPRRGRRASQQHAQDAHPAAPAATGRGWPTRPGRSRGW